MMGGKLLDVLLKPGFVKNTSSRDWIRKGARHGRRPLRVHAHSALPSTRCARRWFCQEAGRLYATEFGGCARRCVVMTVTTVCGWADYPVSAWNGKRSIERR